MVKMKCVTTDCQLHLVGPTNRHHCVTFICAHIEHIYGNHWRNAIFDFKEHNQNGMRAPTPSLLRSRKRPNTPGKQKKSGNCTITEILTMQCEHIVWCLSHCIGMVSTAKQTKQHCNGMLFMHFIFSRRTCIRKFTK